MRKIIPLNENWSFNGEEVRIPHTLKMIPENYFPVTNVTFSGVYTRSITLEKEEIASKAVFLRFEGVGTKATVSVGEEVVCVNECAYNRFDVDLSKFFSQSCTVDVTVEVSAVEDPSIPPYGDRIDYLVFGGIYRPVELVLVPITHIVDMNAFAGADGVVNVDAELAGDGPWMLSILDQEGKKVAECLGTRAFTHTTVTVQDAKLWDIHQGVLYKAVLEFGEDQVERRFGFRTTEFKNTGFYINGRNVKLLGLDRHQSFPIVGYAMPAEMQELDACLVEKSGLNIVRTSHYMQDTAFLDKCDELGILVFEEIPGWQFVSQDQKWRSQVLVNVKSMITRDKSHPCIVLWGVRINESQDDDQLYEKTNALARQLDPFRQTGGVRYIVNSHLLEDVYTMNDFIHSGDNKGLRDPSEIHKEDCPHLVTEYCGHMYPTKVFDDETHRFNHAMRHARVVDAMFGNPKISGCIGWCLFDYNTHADFGSGDMICYHGVCDANRMPKLAWYVYASQSDREPVMGLSSFMDTGDYPGTDMGKVAVFTNADYVKVYRDEEFIGQYSPRVDVCPNLPHPPIIIDDFLQQRLSKIGLTSAADQKKISQIISAARMDPSPDAIKPYRLAIVKLAAKCKMSIPQFVDTITRIQDFSIGGKGVWKFEACKLSEVVGTQIIDPQAPVVLKVTPSATQFRLSDSGCYQVSQIQLEALMEGCSMRLPYLFDSLSVEASGSIELYGTPKLLTLVGGGAAIYVRTCGIGDGKLKITSARFGMKEVEFKVSE